MKGVYWARDQKHRAETNSEYVIFDFPLRNVDMCENYFHWTRVQYICN